ncbi:gamma-secretase subunit pen-2 [Coccinella septempunctata]|uniref:gamma-secretase subunit pen-2 n=1 Tax=Coccinella septempunctata TaxID=41139 RepID=UPI001D05E6B1|nr:gamma-secretase subunit pen-2 [Coccinella septempunctata]
MDLEKMSNLVKLNLCRTYFKAGFALLPFVWAVNAVWFFNDAFRSDDFDEQRDIKKYVIYSAIGATVWIVVLTAWIITFQVNRDNWGEFADRISFIIPLGR